MNFCSGKPRSPASASLCDKVPTLIFLTRSRNSKFLGEYEKWFIIAGENRDILSREATKRAGQLANETNALAKRVLLIQHYVRAYGLHAVVAASLGGRDCVIVTGTNVDARLRALRRSQGALASAEAVWWCATAEDARAILYRFRGLRLTAPDALRRVPIIAISIGVALAPHQTIVRRATAAFKALDSKVKLMNNGGELRAVVDQYRSERLRRQELGLGMMPYSAYLARYRLKMIYQVAAEEQGRAGRSTPLD